jgi:hypothetical protein
MFIADLHNFINQVIDNKRVTAEDVKRLKTDILENGIGSRSEADALLALDRTLDTDPSWADFLTAVMVDYVVWGSRPTGRVPAETAAWLVTAFTCGEPTGNAVRIARAIVAEAQDVDAELLLFARRGTSSFASLAA